MTPGMDPRITCLYSLHVFRAVQLELCVYFMRLLCLFLKIRKTPKEKLVVFCNIQFPLSGSPLGVLFFELLRSYFGVFSRIAMVWNPCL